MKFDSSYSSFVTTLTYQQGQSCREKLVAFRAMPRPGDLVACIVDDATDYIRGRDSSRLLPLPFRTGHETFTSSGS
ncbi:MAG: hypothetical protein F6K47_40350 [Symploca sp. SIO2E6]|nr:hypothetical protein [Symploca sp. SIO2E6]